MRAMAVPGEDVGSDPFEERQTMTAVLASWKDGPARQAILDFVEAATTPGAGVRRSRRIGSPRSTTTARCGSSSRCRRSSTSCFASGRRRSRPTRRWRSSSRTRRSSRRTRRSSRACDAGPAGGGDPAGGVRSLVGGTTPGGVRRAGARVDHDGEAAEARRPVRRAGLSADAGAVRSPAARTSSGCSCAPAVAATSCACSPRRPGGSTRRT